MTAIDLARCAMAVLRRAGQTAMPSPQRVGALKLAPSRREVQVGQGELISLTPLEGRLLDYLMVNAGQVMTFDAIIDRVWGPKGGDKDMQRQLVRRLRRKIEPDPSKPIFIRTIPSLGYELVGDQSAP